MVRWIVVMTLVLMPVLGVLIQPAAGDLPSDMIRRGSEAAQKGDTQQALIEILNVLQQQQQTLDVLMKRSQDQQKLIDRQTEVVQDQQKKLEEQEKQLAEAPRAPEGFSDNYSANKQYELAYDIQHIAIFDVRRKDAPPYFKKAAEEYRKVVTEYPGSDKADDAQYRVGKIYHRYLKDYGNARKEYEFLLKNYPDSEYVDEAREALGTLR